MTNYRNSQILRPLFAIAEVAGSDYVEALKAYYHRYMQDDKKWTESNSPEGTLKEAIKLLANDINDGTLNWLSEFLFKNQCRKIDKTKFQTNTFTIKMLLDQLGHRTFDMAEVHKLIKRVFPNMKLDSTNRTSISIASEPELVLQMKGKTKIATYTLQLDFKDYIESIEKTESPLF